MSVIITADSVEETILERTHWFYWIDATEGERESPCDHVAT